MKRNGQSTSIATSESASDQARDKMSRLALKELPQVTIDTSTGGKYFKSKGVRSPLSLHRAISELNPFSNSSDSDEEVKVIFNNDASQTSKKNLDNSGNIVGTDENNDHTVEEKRSEENRSEEKRSSPIAPSDLVALMKMRQSNGQSNGTVTGNGSYSPSRNSPNTFPDRNIKRYAQSTSPPRSASPSRVEKPIKYEDPSLLSVYASSSCDVIDGDAVIFKNGEKSPDIVRCVEYSNIDLSSDTGVIPNNRALRNNDDACVRSERTDRTEYEQVQQCTTTVLTYDFYDT